MNVVDLVNLNLQASRGVTLNDLICGKLGTGYEFDGKVVLSRTYMVTLDTLVRIEVEVDSVDLLSGHAPSAVLRYTYKTYPRSIETEFVPWSFIAAVGKGEVKARFTDHLDSVMRREAGKVVSK